MSKVFILLFVLTTPALGAEISSSYSLLEKQAAFKPDFNTEDVAHLVSKKESKELDRHPVYRAEDFKNDRRANLEAARNQVPGMKHSEMLADQPSEPMPSVDVNRNDNIAYGYAPGPVEVAYPHIPYAPGYGYDAGYAASNNYESYDNGLTNYLEPDTSTLGFLWSQLPDSRSIVKNVGRAMAWVFSSIFVILFGSLITVGVCSYTNLCTITFNNIGPIHEEMRSLISPERLEKISHAADFVKTAIDKYQKIQKVDVPMEPRNRRSIYFK